MSDTLAQQQKEFLACLQFQLPTEQATFRHQIQNNGKLDIKTRLAIYQNAYQIRLQETIDTDHNILGRYLGGELYELMMNEYINHYPSKQFSLRHFSEQLPAFLTLHSPFNEHPQISEIARFEQRLLNAFDAADGNRASFEELKELPSDSWPELKVRFHPSVQVLENRWNSVEIYQALKENQTPPEPLEKKNNWLLWRNTSRLTEFRPVDEIALSMLKSFQNNYLDYILFLN